MNENQGQVPPPPPAGGPGPGAPEKDVCNLAMLAHLLAILLWLVGPLIIWLVKREDHEFIDDQGKEALNWEITIAIASIACAVLSVVFIGAFLFPIVVAVKVIFNIIGAVKSSNGERYRYPFALRLMK